MKLLIDAGNSRVKWASLHCGEIEPLGACDYRENAEGLADVAAGREPDAIYMASVAESRVAESIQRIAKQTWNREVHHLRSVNSCCGVVNGYSEPERLGIDRWAGMIAARKQGSGAACVIDCGSAVTVDLIDSAGMHRGGYIVPGMKMQKEVLGQQTAAVGVASGHLSSTVWGLDTPSCVSHGVAQSIVGLVERSMRYSREYLQEDVRLVMTGGYAREIGELTDETVVYDEHLVLKGMAEMVMGLEE